MKRVGDGLEEKLVCGNKVLIKVNPKYFRPSEVEILLGDSTKARSKLGWQPKYNLKSLVEDMLA